MKPFCRLFLLLAPLIVGCYTYQPVVGAAPRTHERVRLTLTDSGAVSLASQLGPATEEVSGRLSADSGGAYLVSVLATRRRGGFEIDWRGEQVAVPRALIARAEQRRFSRARTMIASVALVVVAAVAREAFWGPGGAFGGAPPGGGPTPR
jgi:hypothetical protein